MDKRPYHSPLRQEQALATRQRILDAALELFGSSGYGATSIAAVAREAGVVPETIYATFASKRGIVDGLIERAAPPQVVGELVTAWADAVDPRAQLGVLARFITAFWGMNDGLARVFRMGTGEADIANEWARRQNDRHGLFTRLVAGWSPSAFRPGLDRDRAVDICWALASDEMYHQLVRKRGWPADEYERWLADTLRSQLLAAESAPNR